MGYVGAAFELAAQVRAGFLPEPDRIVVAAGTGGTAAGLVAGGRLAGLASRVVAVRVFDAVVANRHVIAAQARAVVRRLRHLDPTLPDVTVDADDLDVDPRWFGGMYGRPTPEAERAVREGAPGLALETTYTGKAFAACLAHCRDAPAGQVVLFWHTHNAVAFPCASSDALPPSLQALLGSSHVQARRSASP